MRELVADSVADRRFVMMLLAATGCLALLLATAGVYGVIAYTTSRRTQEIGIRMAVGATARNIIGLVFRQGFLKVLIGLALGLGAAPFAIRMLGSFLAGIDTGRPIFTVLAALLVAATAAAACWIPARRATRIDPMSALRQE
jgi:putative ABC transport system permease protein